MSAQLFGPLPVAAIGSVTTTSTITNGTMAYTGKAIIINAKTNKVVSFSTMAYVGIALTTLLTTYFVVTSGLLTYTGRAITSGIAGAVSTVVRLFKRGLEFIQELSL